MIQSMTGYGKSTALMGGQRLVVEIKSLNSKQLDLNLRLSALFHDQEMTLRALIGNSLERGKVDVSIYTEALHDKTGAASSPDSSDKTAAQTFTPLNREAFRFFMSEVEALCPELTVAERAQIVLRMPQLSNAAEQSSLSEEEQQTLQHTLEDALQHFVEFRKQEGAALEKMFAEKLNDISALLASIEPYEKSRVENIRMRLTGNLSKLAEETQNAVDHNRLEQEMIFYLEKLDVTEEKVRLANHIRYFFETMQTNGGQGVGKKLGFITQEMGREINTLGSKSNQSEMQIIVVKMKDLLEQIKEQVLNVL